VKYCRENPANAFIIATESGILHRLKKEIPGKTFLPAPTKTCACNDCGFMKMNTLEKMLNALEVLKPEIILDEEIRQRALVPIQRMLTLSA
jgi:quinolinate synthase